MFFFFFFETKGGDTSGRADFALPSHARTRAPSAPRGPTYLFFFADGGGLRARLLLGPRQLGRNRLGTHARTPTRSHVTFFYY